MKEDAAIADAALIGIGVKKEVDFPGWYQQVLTKGDMLDYYDVSGCYILKVIFCSSYASRVKITHFLLAMVFWHLGANPK